MLTNLLTMKILYLYAELKGSHSAGLGSGGEVIIEDGVWIGANSTILTGVIIGKKIDNRSR